MAEPWGSDSDLGSGLNCVRLGANVDVQAEKCHYLAVIDSSKFVSVARIWLAGKALVLVHQPSLFRSITDRFPATTLVIAGSAPRLMP